MDVGSVSTPTSLDGFAESMLGEAHASVASVPAHAPDAPADTAVEAATVQTYARPPMAVADPLPPPDTALPADANALSEFAAPAAQLVPATLVGLQVEAAWGWPLPWRGSDLAAPKQTHAPACEEFREPAMHAMHDRAGDDAPAPQDEPADADAIHADGDDIVFEDADTGDWCQGLTHALRAALATRIPPQALLAAAEQWRRGRCVVLACPQGADPAGPAWAFVLWPRGHSVTASRPASPEQTPLALVGLRVEARLQWSMLPHDAQWCHVRVVKEHHPRRGRQLVAMDGAAARAPAPRVACEVQLGPVLARSLRWCEVCVRIHAVRRFWAALGGQWSVHVVVCSRPLAGTRVLPMQEASC